MGGQRHTQSAIPREGTDTHCIGNWVGSRAGLDGCGKSRPPTGIDPRTVQQVDSESGKKTYFLLTTKSATAAINSYFPANTETRNRTPHIPTASAITCTVCIGSTAVQRQNIDIYQYTA
jgi:hypothetical protein